MGNGCILAGNYRAALVYVEKARASGELNQIGFSNAMEAHYKLGQVTEVRKLWIELCGKYNPNAINLGIYMKVLAREGFLKEMEDVIFSVPTVVDTVGWKCVIHELHSIGNFSGADYFFEKAYKSTKLPIWSNETFNALELHLYSSAVACCAVRYVLRNEETIK